MTPFPEKSKIMKFDRNWTHIALPGLRLKRFESLRCYEANGTPPDPPKLPQKFQTPAKIQWTPPANVYTIFFRQPSLSPQVFPGSIDTHIDSIAI